MLLPDLKPFGANQRLIEALASAGIKELYPPQEEAVRHGLLTRNNSFVISAPTASGKTLLAEMLALKLFFEIQGKVLYLVPLRALARQKFEEFKNKYEKFGIRVFQSTGDFDSADPWLEKGHIIIATNEKIDSLIRHHASWLGDIRLVVVDEVHLIGDVQRGPTLEIVITRLKEMNPQLRFLCLSATIKNAAEIAGWLDAILIESDWRPVPLKEGVYFNDTIMFNDGSLRWIEKKTGLEILNLAVETIEEGGQVLIFVNTRRAAEALAEKAARILAGEQVDKDTTSLNSLSKEISSTGEPTRLSRRLASVVREGVAFHHAGLLGEHRRMIENAFKTNMIKLLVSTTTLAMGLNLPSRRVIIKDWKRYESAKGMEPIRVIEIKQMSGRAGRPGYDPYGEAIIMARSRRDEKFIIENYIKGEPEAIESQLAHEGILRFHVLSSIAGFFTMTVSEVFDFLKHTFYGYKNDVQRLSGLLQRIIKFLVDEDLITEKAGLLKPTTFGKRISELYVDPLTGVILRDALKSDKPKRLISLLHMICHTPDMMTLGVKEKEIEYLLDAYYRYEDELLVNVDEYSIDEILPELKTALCLSEWIEEKTEDELTSRYGIGPGDLHTLVELCDWLLYSASEIARVLRLVHLVKPLSVLRLRVSTGVREELLGLITLKGIGRVRARSLYNAGFKTRNDIKRATLRDLLGIPNIGPGLAQSIKKQVEEEGG